MKTIIITGASGGIGSAIAHALDNPYHKLILMYNKNWEKAVNLKNSLKCESKIIQCDFSSPNEIEKVVNQIITEEDNIFGLINCAGVSIVKQIQDYSTEEINYITTTNLNAPMIITKLVSKAMISLKDGRIINISSMWGVVGASMESVYSASKGGLNTFTLALAKELGPSHITVNSICPGLIDTEMNNNISEDAKREVIESTPLGRIGTPTDISSLVKFLFSEDASFITGQIITVDGGLTL